ncbi:NADPH-dependent 7-cyano-7-deazaguanine reductase QueF [bacterium]|nr:NADPH-dependent 7-cyano-7-deazaguanine reductase QueF [bacterium]
MKEYTDEHAKSTLQNAPQLEAWENQYADRDYEISISIPEFTCVCPRTGQPDFATIYINYVPDKTCVELKSLKLYIASYRNVGIFHENVANKILDDFVKACNPRKITVKSDFTVRGGIHTIVSVSKTKN